MTKLAAALVRFSALSTFAVSAAVGVASAASFKPHPLWGGEEVFDPQGRFESCSVSREYRGENLLSLVLADDETTILMLTRAGLRPPAGWAGYVTVSVDDGPPYKIPAESVGRAVAMDVTLAASLRLSLSRGAWLRLHELDEARYPLDGAADAYRGLVACVAARRPAAPAQVAAQPQPSSPPVSAASPAVPSPEAKEITAEMDTYADEAAAQEDWAMMKRKFADALKGRTPRFAARTRERDGRSFVVMRFGDFADRDAAEAFCRDMRARKRACDVRLRPAADPGQ